MIENREGLSRREFLGGCTALTVAAATGTGAFVTLVAGFVDSIDESIAKNKRKTAYPGNAWAWFIKRNIEDTHLILSFDSPTVRGVKKAHQDLRADWFYPDRGYFRRFQALDGASHLEFFIRVPRDEKESYIIEVQAKNDIVLLEEKEMEYPLSVRLSNIGDSYNQYKAVNLSLMASEIIPRDDPKHPLYQFWMGTTDYMVEVGQISIIGDKKALSSV